MGPKIYTSDIGRHRHRLFTLPQGDSSAMRPLLRLLLLTHLSFGREFTEAVEMKQVAQQEAEKARYLVEKAEQMKLAAITTAEGDAQASKLLAQAFSQVGDGLIELRKLEAAEEIAELLSTSKNVSYLPKDISPLLALPQ
ncbi:hypothetical protein niasHS_003620 [Heterodera schachtii]|uniref:Prohibitin n=1 Tax=Heterodera schachtii TaxID=97005 RepID=A0ABD2KH21_HETSC